MAERDLPLKWVPCPICQEPDMRAENEGEDYWRIYCTNLACPSNQVGKRFVVLDPDSPSDALVERAARALCRKFAGQQLDLPADEYVDRYWPSCIDMARAVLAALENPSADEDRCEATDATT